MHIKDYTDIFPSSWDLTGKVERPDRYYKSGGYGDVFQGTLFGKFVAIKVPQPSVLHDPKYPKVCSIYAISTIHS
jgi:hypothetical protein